MIPKSNTNDMFSFRVLTALFVLTLGAWSSLGDTFRMLSDVNPGSAGSFPSNFTAYSSSIYFNAYSFSSGRELWKFDGTKAVLAADINDTADDSGLGLMEGNDSNSNWFTVYNGQLCFSAYDPRRGGELWRYDGTSATRVADINPDANDAIKFSPFSSWPTGLSVFNNALYFSANSGTARENYELWTYDGSAAHQVINIHPDIGTNQSSYPQNLIIFNNALYFMADDGSNGYELWKHNGAQTVLLNINPGGASSSSYPKLLTPFNGQLYIQAYDTAHGFELWRTDGSAVTLAADINPGSGDSVPEFLTPYNGVLYFRASDPVHGSELWKFDGTQATLAAEINPSGDSYPKSLTVLGSQLIFSANDGVHGWELWKYDGTTTTLVTDLNPAGDSFPESFTVVGTALYFAATTPDTGYEIWKYDGNSVTLAADINPGPADSFPKNLAALNGQLFFSAANDGFSNWEPWILVPDQAPSGPITITSIIQQGASFELTVTGTTGVSCILEKTADFISWSPVSTNVVSGGTAAFSDVSTDSSRFYRVVTK